MENSVSVDKTILRELQNDLNDRYLGLSGEITDDDMSLYNLGYNYEVEGE